jgi:transposase InsO family protein
MTDAMGRIVQSRLDAETLELLARLRRRTGLTDSEILRQGVRRLAEVAGPIPRRRIVGVGKFTSGVADLGSNKKHLKGFGRS